MATKSASKTVSNNANASSAQMSAAAPKQTKKSRLIELLSAGKPISLDDLSRALGWQRHTTSAAMTRLRQDGHALVSEKENGGLRLYHIATPKLTLSKEGAQQGDDADRAGKPASTGPSK